MNTPAHKKTDNILGTATWIWLLLLVFTALTLFIGRMGWEGVAIVALILLLTTIKGKMVVDHFMGLRHVSLMWRIVMYAYLLIVGVLIGVAYIVGIN